MATDVRYGYEMDTSFLQQPHFTDPRRVYSKTSTDWQQRVDFERMRRERLARANAQLEEKDLGAVILFTGENVRYVTGSFQSNWKHNIFIRYAVLARDGEPVQFETVGRSSVSRSPRASATARCGRSRTSGSSPREF